jgi:hypothetical protein
MQSNACGDRDIVDRSPFSLGRTIRLL